MEIKFDKITIVIIFIILFFSILPYSIRTGLTRSDTSAKDFVYDRSRWRAILHEDRETARPFYKVEDLMAEKFKPENWNEFYVLSSIPEGYIVDGLEMSGNGEENVGISYIFYKLKDLTDQNGPTYKETKLTFIQSKNEIEYIPIIQPHKGIMDVEEGKYYQREWKEDKMIYWRKDELILCIKGDYEFEQLEKIANNVECYNMLN